jgi:uncharacterized protein Yka (UPF0111/DUF47 family)
MTKRDIIKFLERKHDEKRSAVEAEYLVLRDQLLESTYTMLDLTEVANQIQQLFSEAGRLWDAWKQQHENTDILEFKARYSSFESRIYEFNNEDGDTLKMLTEYSVKVEPDAMEKLNREYRSQVENVKKTFQAVTATVQQMKFTKEAAVYLKELGFDLSELENPVDQAQTALMVPVDTRYLFVKAA